MKVVLPELFGPINEIASPLLQVSETLLRAVNLPKCFVIFLATIIMQKVSLPEYRHENFQV